MNNLDFYKQVGRAVAMSAQKTDLTDAEALAVKGLQKVWKPGEKVEVGDRRQYKDLLYKCRQAHTTQDNWTPDQYQAGWEVIDETHAGTKDDPIPWTTGMRPEEGKYYFEGNLLARCKEDPGQAIYGPLSSLCPGRYFEPVEKTV